MRHSESPGRAPLRELLRRGDPARVMSPEEGDRVVRAMRRELSSRKEPAQVHLGWKAALAAACLLVIALAGVLRNVSAPERGLHTPPAVEAQISAAGAAPEEAPAPQRPQQIQFRTPGGTRIIWVLHPGSTQDNIERRAL